MSNVEMDRDNVPGTCTTGQGDNPLKRKIVDTDKPGQEAVSLKRPNLTMDEDLEHKVLRWIANCHLRIRYIVTKEQFTPTARYICLGDQVHKIFCAAHQHLRQTNSSINSYLREKTKTDEYHVIISGEIFTAKADDIHTIIMEEAAIEGLQYTRYEPKWYRVAGPCLDLLSGFALRIRELRLGHDNILVSTDGTVAKQIATTKYGIYRAHHILLEGLTFPREKKMNMAQSMGPLTILLAHIRSTKTYAEKWTSAAKRALAHVPEIDTILALTQGRPAAEVMPLLREVANLLLLVTGRPQAIRMFFSPTCFYYLCSRRTIGSLTLIADLQGHPLGPENVKHINFSGAGGFAFYNLMTLCKWVYEGDFTESQASQVFFHGTFGTYKENFGLLQSITNQATWQTREEMGDALKSKTSAKLIEFHPIKLIICYNISSPNQIKYISGSYKQITCVPCFAGRRQRLITADLFTYLQLRRPTTYPGRSLSQLAQFIRETVDELLGEIAKDGPEAKRLLWGRADWYSVEDIKDGKYGNKLENFIPKESGHYFLDRLN